MDNKKAAFLPYHAINEFMTDEYRAEVIRTTLHALPTLPGDISSAVDHLTKKYVTVPGFRNSAKAPTALKIKPLSESFAKHPDLVAAILAAWCVSKPELRQRIYDLLISLDWEILPPDADRRKLPGFLPEWPPGQDFGYLANKFREVYPTVAIPDNDISLMCVWLSGRLPYQTDGQPENTAVDPSGN